VRLLERIEELLAEVSPEKTYPFDYIVYRVTDHRPESVTPVLLSCDDATAGLANVLYDVGRSVPVSADSIREPVFTVEDLSARWRVSAPTVLRWRREGLALRLFKFDRARRKAAVRESLVGRFEADRFRLIRRARARRRLSDQERREMIEEALLGLAREQSCGRILAALSSRFETDHEAVERVLLSAAKSNAALKAFSRSGISRQEADKIFAEYANGTRAEEIAVRRGSSVERIRRSILRCRARRIIKRNVRVIANGEFEAPGAEERILSDAAAGRDTTANGRDELPVYLKGIKDLPLLSKQEEIALFRKYNYLKFAALKLRCLLDVHRPDEALAGKIEDLLAHAEAVRNHIVRSNLRLVPAIARRHYARGTNFPALVSEGNVALLDAVEAFDYSRGNRFSTYAGWAISRRFARAVSEHNYRLTSVDDEVLESAARVEVDFGAPQPAAVAAGVVRALGELSERERIVLESRFGIGKHKEPRTLAELGARLGVTKERIRQIETQALERLRRIVETASPELVPE
jgi:RNA polymerase sigma factor (sigma-70 family)